MKFQLKFRHQKHATVYVYNLYTDDMFHSLTRFCKVLYYPSKSPDLCWEAVGTCDQGADWELQILCKDGPVNYINITNSNLVYRNQFCAMCHGEDLSYAAQPNELKQIETGIYWYKNRMDLYDSVSAGDDELQLIMVLEPRVQIMNRSFISMHEHEYPSHFTSFKPKSSIMCSRFMDERSDYCDDRIMIQATPTNHSLPVWDLGSLACWSQFPKVCDLFVLPQVEEICGKPGCGQRSVLDPHTLKCYPMIDHNLTSTLVKNLNHTWHSHAICSYQSQCKAAEHGLLDVTQLNCYCDHFCIYYNDCCKDSAFQATNETKLDHGTFKCYKDASDLRASASEDGYFWGIMQVDRCPSSITDYEAKSLCEREPRWREYGIVETPVTHIKTGLR